MSGYTTAIPPPCEGKYSLFALIVEWLSGINASILFSRVAFTSSLFMVVENLYSESAMVVGFTIPRPPFFGLSAKLFLSASDTGVIPVIAGRSLSKITLWGHP